MDSRRRPVVFTAAGVCLALALAGSTLQGQQSSAGGLQEALNQAIKRSNELQKAGRLAEAAEQMERAVRLARQHWGEKDARTALGMNNLGMLYLRVGELDRAESHLQQCLKVRQAIFPANHPYIALVHNNLGLVRLAGGDYPEAQRSFKSACDVQRASLEAATEVKADDRLLLARYQKNLGAAVKAQGHYPEAERLYADSLRTVQRLGVPGQLEAAALLNRLGEVHWLLGQYRTAKEEYDQALKVLGQVSDRSAPLWNDTLGATHQNLAVLYKDLGRLDEAEKHYRICLQAWEASRVPTDLDMARCRSNLGYLYQAKGNHERGRELLEQSLTTFRAQPRPHPDMARCLANLGWLYYVQGDYAGAETAYKESLQIRTDLLPSQHPDRALGLQNLALLHASRGRWDLALPAMDRAQRDVLSYAQRILPGVLEQQQLDFLTHVHRRQLHESLSLAQGNPEAAAATAAWLLNGKGLAQEVMAQRALLARDLQDARLAATVKQLTVVRQEMAALTYTEAPTATARGQQRQRLAQLARQEEQLVQEIALATGRLLHAAVAELASVREALPADAVLLEVARVEVWDLQRAPQKGERTEPRYLAWVIPPAGKDAVHVVDLGSADAIDEGVRAVVRAMREAPGEQGTVQRMGEKASTQLARDLLQRVARRILEPVLGQLSGARRWIISADGELWHLPWAALPLPDGRFAVENHVISYVVSGRDLLRKPTGPVGRGALVVADPDYDLTLAGGPPAAGKAGGGHVPPVKRLRYTAAEAKGIAPNLQRYAQAVPETRLEGQARERDVLAVRSPRALVLSTHGYFLDTPHRAPVPGSRAAGSTSTPEGLPDHPLLRCGLIFAGANNRHKALGPGHEDGLLTGVEIVGMDLRGTDLVVLSACQTGQGEVRNGEGVASLRQAFQLAGARSVVATLWEIPERESMQMMVEFFNQLGAGKPKAEALGQAQRSLIEALKDEAGVAHPVYWAGFTITGE